MTGLARGLSAGLARWRAPRAVHDPGRSSRTCGYGWPNDGPGLARSQRPSPAWLLADGTTRYSAKSSPASAMRGQPLIVNTDSAALQTNAAHWTCLNPEIASHHGWLPHPTQPLCWQDTDGGLTAATVIWHRGTIDARQGSHETVGEGSAVVVTPAGLRALANGTVILRVHQIVRTAGGPTRSRQVSTGEPPPLDVNVSA